MVFAARRDGFSRTHRATTAAAFRDLITVVLPAAEACSWLGAGRLYLDRHELPGLGRVRLWRVLLRSGGGKVPGLVAWGAFHLGMDTEGVIVGDDHGLGGVAPGGRPARPAATTSPLRQRTAMGPPHGVEQAPSHGQEGQTWRLSPGSAGRTTASLMSACLVAVISVRVPCLARSRRCCSLVIRTNRRSQTCVGSDAVQGRHQCPTTRVGVDSVAPRTRGWPENFAGSRCREQRVSAGSRRQSRRSRTPGTASY